GIKFLKSDLFNTYNLTPKAYDLIVSNPPYVVTSEIDDLQPEISYEPRIALDGGIDGLDFYGRLINNLTNYLKEGGFLILEIGFKQREPIENIFQKSGNFQVIEVVKDYNSIDRVIVAQNSPASYP
ncbi:MAG: peptide chain release factor N(5)-glutamine methyltransferase, partial [Candidatus Omnitrophica bacterium]|nr:peptide chain release factor N(5)-glutamine methyltransferase [Candidatus Omnitrophota bacterium]